MSTRRAFGIVFSGLILCGPTIVRAQPETITFDPPKVDVIDFYGLRSVKPNLVLQAMGAFEGSPLPASKGDAEFRINQIDRVVASQLEAVYEDGQTILYVGIEERGAPRFPLREPPGGPVLLPAELMNSYEQYLSAARAAALRGSTAEDLTHGHALLADPTARKLQEGFSPVAEQNLELLREVLRESSEEAHRAAAAFLIAYHPRKTEVVNDLQFALRDASSSVRANAVSGLTAFSVLARLDPASQLRISPTWFIEMLNSLSWSDRNRAMWALQILTSERNDSIQAQLRDRALDSLVEMARWKTLRHALPAFILLGRAGGVSEEEIQAAWSSGERERVIKSVLAARDK